MKIKDILEGLKFRKDNLTKAIKVLNEAHSDSSLIPEWEVRLDEIESIYNWIKENSILKQP